MSDHANPNTAETCDCDRPKSKTMHVLDAENLYLWDDLNDAMNEALNGRWSMRCDWIVERIVMLEKTGAIRPNRDSLTFEDDRWVMVVASIDRALNKVSEDTE